jgi:hypothetical protein
MSYRLRIKVENLRKEIGDYIEVPGVFKSLTKACETAEDFKNRTVWVIKDDEIVAEWQGRLIGWKSVIYPSN